jgi:NADPH:quinone reductase-like Zn-dependent oxidoreductase
MARAVRFDHYGGVQVLDVVEVTPPVPASGQVLVRVKAAGINPGEAKIREGLLDELWPSTFPSGQGSDLAGVVDQLGDQVDNFRVGDEVLGFTHDRASQAEFVTVDADDLIKRPPNVPWEVAGSLFVVGTTAYAAVRAVSLEDGDTVVIAGAAGGVGSIAVQLAKRQGATVIGVASNRDHDWLRAHGVIPVTHGAGVGDRIRDAAQRKVDALIDTVGEGYVQLALELGIEPGRIDTIADFQTAEQYGVKTDGNAAAASAEVLAELAATVERGELDVPIGRVYPLAQVRDAYRDLEQHQSRGKIALKP